MFVGESIQTMGQKLKPSNLEADKTYESTDMEAAKDSDSSSKIDEKMDRPPLMIDYENDSKPKRNDSYFNSSSLHLYPELLPNDSINTKGIEIQNHICEKMKKKIELKVPSMWFWSVSWSTNCPVFFSFFWSTKKKLSSLREFLVSLWKFLVEQKKSW